MNILFAGILPAFSLNLWQDVQAMLNYDFMRQALLAGTILSLVAGLVGYFVVLRHQAFAGEALSDVAFTGALGGAALGFNPLLSLLVTTVAVALAMGGLGERLRGRDVAVGIVLSWVLGLGVLFLYLFTSQVSGTGTGFSGITVLFGNILGISNSQLGIIAITSTLALLMLVLIARPLLFASLDPDVAAAKGIPVRALGLGFMALLAITVSEATLAVGALLVLALLLLPAAIAQQVTIRPYAALALSAGLAIAMTWMGITIGFYTGYPSSVCISLLAFASYVAVIGGSALARRLNRAISIEGREATRQLAGKKQTW
ncbi:MAG TPA: metal ABC transporter permease [Ktedonobacteraceae bacterium]|jgi:zinc/manganese transport system permease protein|nr:metal ABC transporter permease [Ktedonobacteraceae bacterium]